jgi:hypothetical protein
MISQPVAKPIMKSTALLLVLKHSAEDSGRRLCTSRLPIPTLYVLSLFHVFGHPVNIAKRIIGNNSRWSSFHGSSDNFGAVVATDAMLLLLLLQFSLLLRHYYCR